MSLVVASLAGALGAISRYAVTSLVQLRMRSEFPAGTLLVNVSGAFFLGLVLGYEGVSSELKIAIVGFLGGFTTFSTWMIETIFLGRFSWRFFLNIGLPTLAGLGAALGALRISA